MLGFLLFSLGCPSSRNDSSPNRSPKAKSVAAVNSFTPPALEPRNRLKDSQELPNLMPVSAIAEESPDAYPISNEFVQKSVYESSRMPAHVLPAGPPEDSQPVVMATPVADVIDSSNPLRLSDNYAAAQPMPAYPQQDNISTGRYETFRTAAKIDPSADVQVIPVADSPANSSTKKTKADSPKEMRPPLDLIRENGEYFAGWPKPKLALLVTGKIEGYLEPCGCAGIERMKGGMGRRYALFKQLRDNGWPVVGLDAGGMARGFGRQAEIKFHTLVDGMRQMDYDGIALGETDVKLPAGELVFETADSQDRKNPFVSANVGLFGLDSEMIHKTRYVEAGGTKIGITAVLGKSFIKDTNNSEIVFADPEKAIQQVLPELLKNAKLLILIVHAPMEETIALAKKFPQFAIVVTSGGQPEPPATWRKIEGSKTILLEVGYKGMYAVVFGIYDDKEKPVRYQRVALDSRESFIEKSKQGVITQETASPEMKNLMTAYQDQLQQIGFAELGLRATPHPQKETGGRFVGTDKCKSCHEESYRVWKKSGHAKAYETLAKLDPPRNYDPECVSCHVVGWNAQRFFPYETGYQSPEKTPHLKDVGCEDCHGPGELHCKAEEGSDEAKMLKYRKAAVITKAQSEKDQCRTCHDGDNSPDFKFETYWPFVEHYENKDK